MKTNNAAIRQDLIENSVDHQVSTLQTPPLRQNNWKRCSTRNSITTLSSGPGNTWKPISIPMPLAASP